MSKEIRKYLENLKDNFGVALHHILNKNVSSTNNLTEQYFKISFGYEQKKDFLELNVVP